MRVVVLHGQVTGFCAHLIQRLASVQQREGSWQVFRVRQLPNSIVPLLAVPRLLDPALHHPVHVDAHDVEAAPHRRVHAQEFTSRRPTDRANDHVLHTYLARHLVQRFRAVLQVRATTTTAEHISIQVNAAIIP